MFLSMVDDCSSVVVVFIVVTLISFNFGEVTLENEILIFIMVKYSKSTD